MPHSVESFKERCERAARHFLQSVVVIDNQAEMFENEWSLKEGDRGNGGRQTKKKLAKRPATGLSKKQVSRVAKPATESFEIPANSDSPAIARERKSHRLRAWLLTERLADKGILCAVYRPDDHQSNRGVDNASMEPSDHPVVIRSVKMAKLADIVVLDWELGGDIEKQEDKGTWKAREIIKATLNEDDEIKGRQRLIAIYTATPTLESVFGDVLQDIGTIKYVGGRLKSVKNKKELSLSNETTRIVFLNKDTEFTESKISTTVSEESLPTHLINEFVKLNMGLLPSIALHSIASVRETTHHLLSTFNARLDPALVSHRSLLPDPLDSEEFVLDLISGELRSALSLNRIGQEHADIRAHKDWIAGQLNSGDHFKLGNHLTITRQEAFDLVTEGSNTIDQTCRAIIIRWIDGSWDRTKPLQHKVIRENLSKKKVKELAENLNISELKRHIDGIPILEPKKLTELFAQDKKIGIEINRDFSRLTTLKREFYGTRKLPSNWIPRLTQGSIIREINENGSLSKEFLLCIQPRCDSVRIKTPLNFPFLTMSSSNIAASIKQLLFVKCPKERGSDPENIKLMLYPFPHRQKIVNFDPEASSGDYIEAVLEKGIWVFKSEEAKYKWVADMKDFLAQKICDQLSERQGSIGLDEFEWLRRSST